MIREVSPRLRKLPAALGLAAVTVVSLWGQADQPLAFEVASVKRVPPNPGGWVVFRFASDKLGGITGNSFKDLNTAVIDLIMDAYHVKDYQIFGLPPWAMRVRGEQYNIEAKAGIDNPTEAQVRQMLQTLLADRFELKSHREQRELAVYHLVLAKNGPKLKEIPADSKSGASMQGLTRIIGNFVDRPVLDKTGLVAPKYEYSWDQTELLAQLREMGKPAPSIFTAVQEQLGLKLEPQKEPVEVLVIDSVQKPSEN